MPKTSDTYLRIYRTVQRIPTGKVATYGQIASLSGFVGQARLVGYALNSLQDDSVPWHRVINAQGRISGRADPGGDKLQRAMLQAEGVRFDARGRIALEEFQWQK